MNQCSRVVAFSLLNFAWFNESTPSTSHIQSRPVGASMQGGASFFMPCKKGLSPERFKHRCFRPTSTFSYTFIHAWFCFKPIGYMYSTNLNSHQFNRIELENGPQVHWNVHLRCQEGLTSNLVVIKSNTKIALPLAMILPVLLRPPRLMVSFKPAANESRHSQGPACVSLVLTVDRTLHQ